MATRRPILENQLRAYRLLLLLPNCWIISTRASDVKHGTLCTHRSDDLTDKILVRSDSWLGDQGAKPENTKIAKTPELMTGSAPNSNNWISSKFLSWVQVR
jgi:hypothetical protein